MLSFAEVTGLDVKSDGPSTKQPAWNDKLRWMSVDCEGAPTAGRDCCDSLLTLMLTPRPLESCPKKPVNKVLVEYSPALGNTGSSAIPIGPTHASGRTPSTSVRVSPDCKNWCAGENSDSVKIGESVAVADPVWVVPDDGPCSSWPPQVNVFSPRP